MDTRRKKGKARDARISMATDDFLLSRTTAIALERSGQLENVIARVTDLQKNEKLNPEYLGMLDAYVKNKVNSNEELTAAIEEGLGGTSYVTEDEQLQGLLSSVSATDESSFNEAIKKLSPTMKETLTDINPFDFDPTKGQKISESDKRAIQRRLGTQLGAVLQIQIQNVGTGDDAYVSFDDEDAVALLGKITENVIDYESNLGYTLSRDTLVAEAIEVIEGLSPALVNKTGNPFGSADETYGAIWAKNNFADAYKANLMDPDNVDPIGIWESLIPVPGNIQPGTIQPGDTLPGLPQ
tara:strand:- start:35 stop:925 length:891 start_codon:yes stop_codon:yes gene_type:complete